MLKDFVIGADPEVFLRSIESGTLVPAIGLIGGTKDEPTSIKNGCFVQEDNVLAEFNIPPVSRFEDFESLISYSKSWIEATAASHGLELHYSSSEIFDPSMLSHPDARRFGCSPSWNAFLGQLHIIDEVDIPDESKTLRTSGFHIHFGWNDTSEITPDNQERMVLAFELMCSMPLSKDDLDLHHRRQFYGLFGDYREKEYGVECRSLGGYFLRDTESLKQVWNGIEKTIDLYNSDIKTSDLLEMGDFCLDDDMIVDHTKLEQITQRIEKQIKIKEKVLK